ncbi:hypothetical protein [Glycomyces sambucus]|uniref:hypothetical protein n=1 Tax=Glycomyces sambucus TaxID=380244 RepID=UPI000B876481|nr:hypothetical protein [Glycomyces sambucus]
MEGDERIRFSQVDRDDVDYVVKMLTMDELIAAHELTKEHHWGAAWSSTDALRAEVDPYSPKFLLPALRNAAGDSEVESLRCHLWFLPRQGPRISHATTFDIELARFQALREIPQDKAFAALKLLIAYHSLSATG